MKKTLPFITLLLLLFSTVHAQFLPGIFYHDLGYSYGANGSSPCVVDSSFYLIRDGGVESFSPATDSVRYQYDRFYTAQAIKKYADSSMILLKGGWVYRYFPANDSMANISGNLAATVTDIDAADSVIWAIIAFNQLGRYTPSAGWQILTLGSSYDPSRILAQSDTSVYLADNTTVRLYRPSGLSSDIFTFTNSGSLTEWSIDKAGNAWMIADYQLLELSPAGISTAFDDTNLPLHLFATGDTYNHVAVDSQGNIWASSNYGHLFKDSTAWGVYIFDNGSDYINAVTTDHTNNTMYVLAADTLYMINGTNITHHIFGNMPYHNSKAVSLTNIATDQGIFTYSQYNAIVPYYFKDTSSAKYANDVTCFVVNNDQIVDTGYGTHHGVFCTTYPINNSQLPDSNINCIYYMNGSYYIGTNKGLCIYNQIVYTTYDTSNSGLPNDTVTSVISYLSPYTNTQELWVGTTAGAALYSNGQWHKFDTSIVHIPTFNVTGILPCPLFYTDPDTSIWITTLGSGLVKLKRDSGYTILNTANGGLKDDSLYYITQYYGCVYYGTIMLGTNSHGIAYYSMQTNAFEYDSVGYYNGGNAVYHRSNLFANPYTTNSYYYNSGMIMVTDQGIDIVGMCAGEGVKNTTADPQNIKWYQMSDDKLQVILPDVFTGLSSFCMYDMMGRKVISSAQDVRSDTKTNIDISTLSSGVYALQASDGSVTIQTKVIISK